MISQAMLMAAGLGTRLKPFTLDMPKAFMPVMGIPIAHYAIRTWAERGIERVVVNVHAHAKKAAMMLEKMSEEMSEEMLEKMPIEIKISDESMQLMGSAGGIGKASSFFSQEPFFLANADVLCDIDWEALEHCHRRLREQWGVELTIAVSSLTNLGAASFGSYPEVFFDLKTGLVTGLGGLGVGKPFYLGAAVLENEAVKRIPAGSCSDFVSAILNPAICEKKVGVFFWSGIWCEIGRPHAWLRTHLELMDRYETGSFLTKNSLLWKKWIKAANVRKNEKFWIASSFSQDFDGTAPCYWGGGIKPPFKLGPQAVLYGSGEPQKQYASGIGLGRFWHPIDKERLIVKR